ncbi:MAG: PQQ-binding-like beta-propeller repeat protein [Planctomycetota bacterium]
MSRSLWTVWLGCLLCRTVCADSPSPGTRAYWAAARAGDLTALRESLAAGIDVDAVTEFNCGAIYFAANRNQAEAIRLLVEAGADVNLRDTDYGFTPVQMAAWLGHTEATEALIEAGATQNDVIGSAFAAASNGHVDTVKLIAEKLSLPAAQLNALRGAADRSGRSEVSEMLVELGATPPAKPAEEATETKQATEAAPQAQAADDVPRYDFDGEQSLPVQGELNWPAFRGAQRTGLADGQHPPAAFDLQHGRNVRWRVDVEGLGLSSPIIFDGKIYVTTAVSATTEQTIDDGGLGWIDAVDEDVPHQWKVLCYDLANGGLIWERTACEGRPKSQRHWKSSQANSTCVTDGTHLIACFGSEGLFCFDLEGNLRWQVDLGRLDAGWYIDSTFPWGFASSPVIYEDTVLLQCDIDEDPFLISFALEDGRELWRTERDGELPSWGTPLVVRGERDELVTNASKAIRAYDPGSGELLWEVQGNSPITVSSPICSDGLIVATGGYKTPQPIYVVRAGKAMGDVTPETDDGSECIAWSRQTGGTYVVTPLLYRGLLYLCKQNGVMSVYDPASGELKYQERLNTGDITASPVAADGRIYFVGEDGRVVVISAGETFDEIAISPLGESILASPAVSNGTLVFRTVRQLIAIGHDQS